MIPPQVKQEARKELARKEQVMTKLKISTHNSAKVIELDTNKQYALIFAEELSPQDFKMYVDMLKENGMSKFISINDPSRVKLKELGGM